MTQKKSESKSALEKKAKVQALRRGPDLDRYLEGRKRKFVSYAEGARIYSINYYSFVKLAKAAKANIQIIFNELMQLEKRKYRNRKSKRALPIFLQQRNKYSNYLIDFLLM